jgi:signal transduction histidine kinase/ActR/RegA family two-component response regulator
MHLPDVDAAARIARLEARLARERQARAAAERIAEQGMLNLYRHQRRLELLQTVAAAANAVDEPDEAFRLALERICEFTGWPVGHVCMFSHEDASVLCSSGVWFGADDARLAPFREASGSVTFAPGVGLPGRVLASRAPVWIEDVTAEANFPRAPAAGASGLKGGFAFPALIGGDVGAVLEFYQSAPAAPDPDLLEALAEIGVQLGRVVERYRHARRLKIERDGAQAANRAKSAFLAVTSHEIRTPLNAVLGLAEALKREPLTTRQHELNDGVLESGAMLLRLLNAVLDMSRIEADQATASLDDFDLVAKLRSIASIWTPRARELGIDLALDVADLRLDRIRSDEGRLEQTLVNLISNALKFTPAGGRVLIRALGEDRRLRIEVVDGGPGIDPVDRERIFQPFEQTASGRAAGGAGLGLSICAGNLRLLGGRIGADRDEAGASRFWIECPVFTAQTAASAAAPGETDVAGGLRVLAAEDNPGNRRVLEVLLAPLGIDLFMVENGKEALDALRARAFDLVLMDANMPVMDGVEAVRRIRDGNLAGDAAVYMLTANAFADDVASYMAAGADGVLTKPIQIPALFSVLSGRGLPATVVGQHAA